MEDVDAWLQLNRAGRSICHCFADSAELNVAAGDVLLEGVFATCPIYCLMPAAAGMSATDWFAIALRSVYPPAAVGGRRRFDQGYSPARVEVFGDVMLAEGYELRLNLEGRRR